MKLKRNARLSKVILIYFLSKKRSVMRIIKDTILITTIEISRPAIKVITPIASTIQAYINKLR